jgi:hypothetical protein
MRTAFRGQKVGLEMTARRFALECLDDLAGDLNSAPDAIKLALDQLERLPVTWNHVTDKKSLQFNRFEHRTQKREPILGQIGCSKRQEHALGQ